MARLLRKPRRLVEVVQLALIAPCSDRSRGIGVPKGKVLAIGTFLVEFISARVRAIARRDKTTHRVFPDTIVRPSPRVLHQSLIPDQRTRIVCSAIVIAGLQHGILEVLERRVRSRAGDSRRDSDRFSRLKGRADGNDDDILSGDAADYSSARKKETPLQKGTGRSSSHSRHDGALPAVDKPRRCRCASAQCILSSGFRRRCGSGALFDRFHVRVSPVLFLDFGETRSRGDEMAASHPINWETTTAASAGRRVPAALTNGCSAWVASATGNGGGWAGRKWMFVSELRMFQQALTLARRGF